MKFDHALGTSIDVKEVAIEDRKLEQRKCHRCEGTIFYPVRIRSVDAEGVTHVRYQAMCEGCKLVAELV